MDNRAVSPVVGKGLAAGLAVLYVAGMLGLLVGGIVPDYRTTTSEELGERVLATAAANVERAQPATEGNASVRARTALPATIRDRQYRLLVRNRTLVLDHPAEGVEARTRLALPSNVTVSDGTWHSGDGLVVVVTGPPTNRTLELREDDR